MALVTCDVIVLQFHTLVSTMVVIDRAVSIFDFEGFLDYGLTF